jgi:glucokinase
MFLGIEIGGTKLQLGLGRGDGVITALWRGTVNSAEGCEGIRETIVAAVPELLEKANAERSAIRGVGIGFGGPTDDATQTVIKSHQIAGWDGFPIAHWMTALTGVPAVLGNDADVAGLAEAHFGAGKGLSPIFYITVGTGVGGGLIIDGKIYRGVGKGAAEVGHLNVGSAGQTVEEIASGRGIERLAKSANASAVAAAAREGDREAQKVIDTAIGALADGICHVIALLCPRRIVIGGGVSLVGEELYFTPLRRKVEERVFEPFRGLTDIEPAALGEEVVVHGALALARQKFGQ